MNDFIDVGSAPTCEDCAQVGRDDYCPRALRECRAYIAQLRRQFGPEPDGAFLSIKRNPHDFGTYLSVVCNYDPRKPASVEYAFGCEAGAPEEWDEEARRDLSAKERR